MTNCLAPTRLRKLSTASGATFLSPRHKRYRSLQKAVTLKSRPPARMQKISLYILLNLKSCSVSQNWNHIRSGEQTRVQRGERRKKNSVLCAACLRPAEQSGELCPAQRPALLAALFVAGKQLVPANQTASETSKSERKPNKYCGHVCDVSLEDQMVKIEKTRSCSPKCC
jgi:hypothetical protein